MSGIVKTIQVPGNKLPILPTEIWQMIAEALVNAIFSDFKYLHFSRNDPSEISPMRLEYEDDRILFQRLNQTRLINRQFNRMIGQTHVVRSIFARISALNHLPCIDSVGYNIAAGEWELVISANIW
jgi:hypothetical protein